MVNDLSKGNPDSIKVASSDVNLITSLVDNFGFDIPNLNPKILLGFDNPILIGIKPWLCNSNNNLFSSTASRSPCSVFPCWFTAL